MKAVGADFLDVWIDASISGEPEEQANAGNLAAKLLADDCVTATKITTKLQGFKVETPATGLPFFLLTN